MNRLRFGIILVLVFASFANAEWVGCDLTTDTGIVSVGVVVNGTETVIPYVVNSAGNAVLLLDIENVGAANISAYFINDQGRRSDPSVPFVLKVKPSASTGFRIVQE